MGELWIEGGSPLSGEIPIQGSKNAALPIMAAALLQEGITVLRDCPRIADVYAMEKILESLGVKTHWKGHRLTLDCRQLRPQPIIGKYAESMRSSIILAGSMLARTGKVQLAYPGGCTIGARPIDLHLKVLQAMGVQIDTSEQLLSARAVRPLQAISFRFPFSSVGATETALLAASAAEGVTELENCAAEPEIVHLCEFLQQMGVSIQGIGTRKLWVQGTQLLKSPDAVIPPDRIVAGTYLFGAAATRGRITLLNAPVEEMKSVLDVYEKMGGQWVWRSGKLKADASGICRPISYLETACYPGFPTDLQSALMTALLTIPGESHICEQIFEDRFKIVPQLRRMGAKILVRKQEAVIYGGKPLTGSQVEAQELRGGAALVIAGLAARGRTIVRHSHYMERGYENLVEDIARLGGRIQIKNPGAPGDKKLVVENWGLKQVVESGRLKIDN